MLLNLDIMRAVGRAGEENTPRCLTSHEIAEQLQIGDYKPSVWKLLRVVDVLVQSKRLTPAIKGRGGGDPKTVYYDPGMEEMLVAAGVLSRESWVLEIKSDPVAEDIATTWLTETELEKQRLAARAAAAAARTNRSAGKTVGRSKR